MNLDKQRKFNERMGRQKLFKGGHIKRKNYATGSAVLGDTAAGAGLGTAVLPGIGTGVGAVAGLLTGLFSGGGPQMPNIVDPVTGQQITDASGRVIASQEQLQSFASNLQGVNGVQNQQSVFSQLQGIANGTGPNPALAQLAQSTASNVNQTAAEQAGQRGASTNVGLMARQIGQQGAETQQAAAGQAATLESQQQLNALNAEGGIAGQQVSETQNALNSAGDLAATNQGQLLNAQGQYNTAITGGQSNVNTNNTSTLNAALPIASSIVGGALGGTGANSVKNGVTGSSPSGNTVNGVNAGGGKTNYANGGEIFPGPHKSHVANFLLAKGGKVPAMVSPGEISLNPEQVKRVLNGENPLKIGDKIGGHAKVRGDSKKNDIVPKTLQEGGVVIPRTHAKDSDKAELFVRRAVHAVHMKKAK